MKKILSVFLVTSVMLAGCEKAVDAQISMIHDEISDDLVKQYEMARRQGDQIAICIQAGKVSTAYLQAKNEVKYNEWKAIEKADCAASIAQ